MKIDEVIEALTLVRERRGNVEVVVKNVDNEYEDNFRIGSVRGWLETGYQIYEQVAMIVMEKDE